MITLEDMDEIDLSGTKVPTKSATVNMTGARKKYVGVEKLFIGRYVMMSFASSDLIN